MLDVLNLPSQNSCDVQIFNRPCTVTATQWETWRKPRGVSMAFMLAVGGGGGGGGGFTRTAGNAGGGGGGGGSAALARLIIPTIFLPNILFVQVGAGGVGVPSGGGTAPSGISSQVSIDTRSAGGNLLFRSGNGVPAVGGVTGTGAAAGTGGAAEGVATAVLPWIHIGVWNAIAGQAGVNGGAQTGAVGTDITINNTTGLCQAGAGGAGAQSADFAGGGCTAIANHFISDSRPSTAAAGSNAGSGGPQLWTPFQAFGGLGGASSNAGVGGNGGNGAIGSGGGGGGAGTTGGKGGDGGAGIVVIISW